MQTAILHSLGKSFIWLREVKLSRVLFIFFLRVAVCFEAKKTPKYEKIPNDSSKIFISYFSFLTVLVAAVNSIALGFGTAPLSLCSRVCVSKKVCQL